MMVTVQETVGRRVRFVKPAKFDYLRAENIDQVVEALDQGDGEAWELFEDFDALH